MITPAYQRAKAANQLASQVTVPELTWSLVDANFCYD